MIKYSCIFFGIFVQFYLNAAEELKRDDKQTYVKNTSSPGSFFKKSKTINEGEDEDKNLSNNIFLNFPKIEEYKKIEHKIKIAIIGGGGAGSMIAAILSNMSYESLFYGFDITIFEKNEHILTGTFGAAAVLHSGAGEYAEDTTTATHCRLAGILFKKIFGDLYADKNNKPVVYATKKNATLTSKTQLDTDKEACEKAKENLSGSNSRRDIRNHVKIEDDTWKLIGGDEVPDAVLSNDDTPMKAFERNAILRKHIRDARNINVRTCCTVNKVTKVLNETGSKFKIEFDENVKKVSSQPETKMSSLNQNSANFDHVFITLWDQTFNLLEKSGQIDPIKKESLKECLMTENLTDNTFFENLFESNLKKSDSFSTDMDSDNETSFYPYCYDDYFSLNSNEDKSKPETLLLKTKFYSSDKKKSAFGMLKKALTHQCAIKAIPSDCSIFTDDEDSRVSVSEKHDSLQKFNNIHSACSSSLTTCESVADISFDENELTQEGGSSSKRGGVLKFSRDQMAYLSKLKTYPRVMSVVKNNTPRHNFNPTFVLGGGGMLMSLSGDRTVNFKKAKSLNATSMHQKSIVNDQFPCDQRSSDLNNTFCYSKLNCVYYCEEGASYSKTDDDLIEDDAINEYGETIVKCFKKMLPVVTDNIEYLGAQRLMLVRRGDQNAGIREYQPPALTQDDMIVAIPLKATYVALIAFESIKILLNLMGGDGTPGFSEFKNYWLNIFENIVSDTNPFHVGNNIDIINKYQNVFNIYHNPKSAQINFEAELYLKNCTLNEKGKEILKTCHEKIESSNLYLSDLPLIRSLSDGSYYDQTKISTGELKKIPSKLDLTTWINSEKVSR